MKEEKIINEENSIKDDKKNSCTLNYNTEEIDKAIESKDNKIYEVDGLAFAYLNEYNRTDKFSKNEIYPKYFAKITSENENCIYIGVLNNNFKRDKYGYSLINKNEEYLGEYKNGIKTGFGIYKRVENKICDIYIGNLENNIRKGKGIFLTINDKDITCRMGISDYIKKENKNIYVLKKAKIYTLKNGKESFFEGEVNKDFLPEDGENFIIEGGNIICKGKFKNQKLIEGVIAEYNKNGKKIKIYKCFKQEGDLVNEYKYEAIIDDKDAINKEIEDKYLKYNDFNYRNMIDKLLNDIKEAIESCKNFKNFYSMNFYKTVKFKLESEYINKLV